jgi:hypothetical protein
MKNKLNIIKNSFLVILLTFGSVHQSNAQAAIIALIFGDKVATENFNIGLELGGNFSRFSNMSQDKAKYGLNFGISGNIKLSENWFLSPTAYFVSKRVFEIDNYSLNTGNISIDDQFIDKTASYQLNYIDVPILLCYQTNNKKYRFGVAPQISFLTDSKVTVTGDEGDFIQDIKDNTNSIDYGILANVGYSLGQARKGRGIFVQLRYYQGFADIFNDAISTSTNKGSYMALHLSLPFVTDAIAKKNLQSINK